MNQPQSAPAPEDKAVKVTVSIEIETTITAERSLNKVMTAAQAVAAEARKCGTVKAELVFGRQRLAID
jgi:hypothetical protein